MNNLYSCDTIVLDDRILYYSGFIFIDDLTNWVENLDINNLSILHEQLCNIDGQFSLCLVSNTHTTIVRDYFGVKPFGYFIKGNKLICSHVPGELVRQYGAFYSVPRNSIWSFDRDAQRVLCSKSYCIDYNKKTTWDDVKTNLELAVKKVCDSGPTGLPLSSGFDSGIVDCVACNSDKDITAIATFPKGEDKQTLAARSKYRQDRNKILPSKLFAKSTISIDDAVKTLDFILGVHCSDASISSVLASFAMAEFFAKKNCQNVIIANTRVFLWSPWTHNRCQMQLSDMTPGFIWPENMQLMLENTPLSYIDVNSFEWNTVDCIPYLHHGLKTYHLYLDWNVFHSWVQLPQKQKNYLGKTYESNNLKSSYSWDRIWLMEDILNKYNYPHHTAKIGGPYV